MGEDDIYADTVILTRPEDITTDPMSQYSVKEQAKAFHDTLILYNQKKEEIASKGLVFGGRVLLIGAHGTDFDAFVHHLAQEIPIRLLRIRLDRVLARSDGVRESISFWFDYARRNAPAILYLERLDHLAQKSAAESALLSVEAERATWDADEVLLVASTTSPQDVNGELLSVFNKTFISESATLDDRVRLFEAAFSNREEFEPTVLAEMTEGWSFGEVKHLTVSLLLTQKNEGEITTESLERLVTESGVLPVGRKGVFERMTARIQGMQPPTVDALEQEYPDDFLDQLYLLAVGENYSECQRVIEALNSGLPLSSRDFDFLSNYPFLMKGSAEDRLTRLLRAKKANDRLRRIMGR